MMEFYLAYRSVSINHTHRLSIKSKDKEKCTDHEHQLEFVPMPLLTEDHKHQPI